MLRGSRHLNDHYFAGPTGTGTFSISIGLRPLFLPFSSFPVSPSPNLNLDKAEGYGFRPIICSKFPVGDRWALTCVSHHRLNPLDPISNQDYLRQGRDDNLVPHAVPACLPKGLELVETVVFAFSGQPVSIGTNDPPRAKKGTEPFFVLAPAAKARHKLRLTTFPRCFNDLAPYTSAADSPWPLSWKRSPESRTPWPPQPKSPPTGATLSVPPAPGPPPAKPAPAPTPTNTGSMPTPDPRQPKTPQKSAG